MILRFRKFELSPDLRELRRDGRPVAIQKKVLDLLLYLIRFRGRVVAREELLAKVWPDAVVTGHALDQALYQARKVLGDDGGIRQILQTLRGRGVRFSAEVTEVPERPESKTAPFVGRVELVGAFECALRAASEGVGRLILLGGEPGIGKTRVAEKFASLARFWQRASQRRPIVLILEDLHRADDSSWRLLQLVTRELGSSRVLVVGTYRDTELPSDMGASLGELARLPSARCFQLEGFSREEVARFAELTIGARPSPETVTLLHEHSNGNPFFLTQLIPLVETHSDGSSDLRVGGERGFELPRSSREAILRQLAGLSPTCRELLTVAAVIGCEFDPRVLQLATGHSREAVLDALNAALEARAVRQSQERIGLLRFQHILVREALRESLAAVDRVRVHKRVGEALEGLYGSESEEHLAELAHHFSEAVPVGEEERAIAYAAAAGRVASEQLEFEEAVRQYQRALQVAEQSAIPRKRSVCDLLLALGGARIRAGMRDDAREAFRRAGEIARRLGDPERLARAAIEVAPAFFAIETGVCDPLVVSLLEVALAALPPGDTELRAQLLGRLAMALYWSDSLPRREQLIQEAAGIAERLNQPATTAFVTHARIVALWSSDSFDDRRRQSPEVIARAEEAGNRELSLIGRVSRIATLLEGAERKDLDREIDAFCRLVQDPRHRGVRWYASLFRAMRATLEGRFGDAELLARDFLLEGHRFRDPNATSSFAALMATLRWHQGRGQEVIDCLARFGDSDPAVVAWRVASMRVRVACGRAREATLDFDRLARRAFSSVPRDMNWLFCMALLAEVCGVSNDVGRSAVLYRLARGYADRWVMAGYGAIPWGPMARALGILATVQSRWSEAEAHFRAALEVAERIGAWPSIAWTLDAHARMLLARDESRDRARAMELARRANEISHRLGMDGLSRATRSLF